LYEFGCFEGGLSAIANTERAHKPGHMDFCRCLGDIQRSGDLFVRKTPNQEREHLALAFC
jgi:hypothetical protein